MSLAERPLQDVHGKSKCAKYVNIVPNMSILCQTCQYCAKHVNIVSNMSILCQICQYCAKYVNIVPNMSILCQICQYCAKYVKRDPYKMCHASLYMSLANSKTHIYSYIGRQRLEDSYTLTHRVA